MCGIAGAFGENGDIRKLKELVERIVYSQQRRGPDHHAVEIVDRNLVFGHNRLNIIDLTPLANQPMWDSGKRYCLVYNGEIYNYIELKAELQALGHYFITKSDSEVIIEAFKEWGEHAWAKFNGMFAFALFDSFEGKLYLVRDRFGVKPLYYYLDSYQLIFASTCKVIAQYFGLPPNTNYLSCGLQYGFYEFGDISPYVGIKALEPGHYLKIGINNGFLVSQIHRYYDLEEKVAALREAIASISVSALVNMTSELLEDAVKIRLRADVPVGVSLSGGLDSSVLAYIASVNYQGNLTGFTFGSPHVPATEGQLVYEFSREIGIDIQFVYPDSSKIVAIFPEVIEAQEGPFLSGSIIAQYLVFKAAKQSEVKTLIGGQGSDEAFMGYRKYLLFYLSDLIRRRDYKAAIGFGLYLIPSAVAELGQFSVYWYQRSRYFRKQGMNTILNLQPAEFTELGLEPGQMLWQRQAKDILKYSLPTLLRYEDNNSMGNSVESRLPFMDYRLVELGLALPDALKINKGLGKWVLRVTAKDKILDNIRKARYKRGFDVPIHEWIRNGLGTAVRAALYEKENVIKDFIRPNSNINEQFSDQCLIKRPGAFAEAVTLIWLGENTK